MEITIVSVLAVIILCGLIYFLFFRKTLPKQNEQELPPPKTQSSPQVVVAQEKTVSWQDRLFKGLKASREDIWSKMVDILQGKNSDKELLLEEVEELLYATDIGPQVVSGILEHLRKELRSGEVLEMDKVKNILRQFFIEGMGPVQEGIQNQQNQNHSPKVIMIVGVNGAGKTTTIGKLATRLQRDSGKVLVGACDTFRAAAVDQLQVWCDRANCKMLRAKDGADPSGVAFEALKMAKEEKYDYCLIDTAGRLHVNLNLMEELKKMKRVLSKVDPTAPHEVWLVIDAITGQNALRQAEEFHRALQLTGLIFTKCDGSAKAGNAYTIVQNLKVPIRFIGVGEDVEDLNQFVLNDYLQALLGD